MRNLINISHSKAEFGNDLPLSATTWDAATNSVICAFGPTKTSISIRLKRILESAPNNTGPVSQSQDIVSWEAPCPLPDLDCDKILDLHYFPEDLTTCLILAGGDIVVVREEPLPDEDKIEIVGSVDAGITAAAWAPDEELLAITTRADTLLLMTRSYENITAISMTSEDLKASKHVSVGWGKSETQFKGKRAKALRDPTMPERVDEGTPSPFDKGETTISWRGDGAYLAVNSVIQETRRAIRIYSREGTLDSVTEPVDGLEGALSWRPSGNLMAGIQRLEDRIDVVFFERNGLRHGQFSLRLTAEELRMWGSDISLKWNVDSTVLAVCFKDRVQLWTTGNYHWYLKQEISRASDLEDPQGPLFAGWHPERALRLTVASKDAAEVLEYAFDVAKGSTTPPNDSGIVGVIDGKSLKLTPIRLANVPPPMSLHDITLKSNAVDVAFSRSGSQVAVLEGGSVTLSNWNLGKRPVSAPSLQRSFPIIVPDGSHPRQICFLGDSRIFILASSGAKSTAQVLCLDTDEQFLPCDWILQTGVSRLFTSSDHQSICVHSDDRSVSEIKGLDMTSTHQEGSSLSLQQFTKLPLQAPWVEVVHYGDETIAFGLSANGTLYANDRLLLKNCTSFLVTPAHVILTTTQSLLKFVHMNTVQELDVPHDNPEVDERCRSLERGAKLVTVMPTSFSLTLQMPRGNLETIYPRALVLAGIRRSINAKRYHTAFFACRNQRVDMNILHDHAPEQFMANVELFIDQIKKVEHIDLFLSQLREEDVSVSMYKETLQKDDNAMNGQAINGVNGASTAKLAATSSTSKINKICDAFLEVLQNRASTNLQNIITAHVCKSPPDLNAGLLVAAKLRAEDIDAAERAVEHICFLADVNRLYDNALGLYDLDLALLVAQQSQKDPREYIPFLQNLQQMPTLRKQFTIDDHLARYTKALSHLYSLNAFDEILTYMQKHELYKEAIEIYRYQETELNQLMRLYADYLLAHSKFKEAGIAYEYLSDLTAASESYRAAQLWRESLCCATLIPLPASQLQALAHALADTLAESKDHASAAMIHLDYLEDIETAARLYCKGYHFAEAMRLLGLRQRPDLFETIVDAGLAEGLAGMTELLAECKAQLGAQVPRLQELRVKKAEDPRKSHPPLFSLTKATTHSRTPLFSKLESGQQEELTWACFCRPIVSFFDGGGGGGGADIPDNVSLAPTDTSTSAGTFMTRYTSRSNSTLHTTTTRKTSKNRRREERKRARGKKGSVYEEEYLVASIERLIERVNSVGDELARLVEGLLRRCMRERARGVEAAYCHLLALCAACLDDVFGLADDKEAAPTNRAGGASMGADEDPAAAAGPSGVRPGGADGVFWDSLEGAGRRLQRPVIRSFQRSALLGVEVL
ncbi:MAG: hypothetical protein M1819_006558 [Sarea resinae]|nr:MAG: hypothetical protein M1819_006558 [Sarea resinae]